MGAFSLLVPDRTNLADYFLSTSHLIGFDGVPWQCEQAMHDDQLVITRQESESGVVFVPWKVEGQVFGLNSGTLCERVKPYILSVEMARGTLNRIRNQLATWQIQGYQVDDQAKQWIGQALDQLAEAVTCQKDVEKAEGMVASTLKLALHAMRYITSDYVDYYEKKRQRTNTFWHGFELNPDEKKIHKPDSNVAFLPISWSDVEVNQDQFQWDRFDDAVNWCKDESICVMAGQFFDLHREAIPDWLYLWQDQTHSIESLLRRFVTTAVQRYIGMVHLWHCHAGTLGQTKLGLNEEEQLRLTVAVIESIRQIDKSTPLLITIEQPFGEHMIRDELDLSPIQFADMLARGDIGVTGFNIRLNFGTDLSHTLIRDPFEIGRLIDMWSLLGKPLVVEVGISDIEQVGTNVDAIQQILRMISTKNAVQGVLIDQSLQPYV